LTEYDAGMVRGGEVAPGVDGPHLHGAFPWRSLLFFPGSRAELYPKAQASGADLVTADLEDAVGPDHKVAARESVSRLLASPGWNAGRSAVRINPPFSRLGGADLESLALALTERFVGGGGSDAPTPRLTLVVPKVSAPNELLAVHEAFEGVGASVRLVAMIETAAGLEAAPAVARTRGVAALFLGAVDLAAELGCDVSWDALLYARSRLVHAAALGGVWTLDVPALALDDPGGVEEETRAVARLGFTGKAAIHPGR
jgi:(S)-citramalyl-CoA lyase